MSYLKNVVRFKVQTTTCLLWVFSELGHLQNRRTFNIPFFTNHKKDVYMITANDGHLVIWPLFVGQWVRELGWPVENICEYVDNGKQSATH